MSIEQPRWTFRLGGSLTVVRPDGVDATPRGRKARALLAWLALAPEHSASRDKLVRLFWSDRAGMQGRASLRQCLVELRAEVAPLLNISNDSVALNAGSIYLDTNVGDGALPMAELDHLDPAFDRWLGTYREELNRPASKYASPQLSIDSHAAASLPRRSVILSLAIAGLILAISVLSMGRWIKPDAESKTSPVVAVHPFATMSDDREAQAAANWIRDDIPAEIPSGPEVTQRDDLRGPSSLMARPSNWLIEGRILSGPQPLVQARITTGTGIALWSHTFSAPGNSLGVLAAAASTRLGAVIVCASAGPAMRRTDWVASLLLVACEAIVGAEGYGGANAITAIRRMAEQAPEDPLAHAMLGTALATAATQEPAPLAQKDRSEARLELRRSAGINALTGTGFLGQAMLWSGTSRFAHQESLLSRGLSIEPDNPLLNAAMAGFLAGVGRSDEAVVYSKRSVALDPGMEVLQSELAQILSQAHQSGTALALLDQADQVHPLNANLISARFTILMRGGHPAEARMLLDRDATARQLVEPSERADMRRQAFAIEHPHSPGAASIASDLIASAASDPMTASRPVLVLANLGRLDEAISIATREDLVTDVLFRPSSTNLLLDRRFPIVAKRQGLWWYWKATGHWPDICQDTRLKWRCGGA